MLTSVSLSSPKKPEIRYQLLKAGLRVDGTRHRFWLSAGQRVYLGGAAIHVQFDHLLDEDRYVPMLIVDGATRIVQPLSDAVVDLSLCMYWVAVPRALLFVADRPVRALIEFMRGEDFIQALRRPH